MFVVVTAGCLNLGVPERNVQEALVVIHSVAHLLDPKDDMTIVFRVSNPNAEVLEWWEASATIHLVAENGTRDLRSARLPQASGALAAGDTVEGKLRATSDQAFQPSTFFYRLKIAAGPNPHGRQAQVDFQMPCYRLPTLERIPQCGEDQMLSTFFFAHLPDMPAWQSFLAECCGWQHRLADIYDLQCEAANSFLESSNVGCDFIVANIAPDAGRVAGTLEVFSNGTGGSRSRIGASEFVTNLSLQPRQATPVFAAVTGPSIGLASSVMVRLSVWPEGQPEAVAVEERWIPVPLPLNPPAHLPTGEAGSPGGRVRAAS